MVAPFFRNPPRKDLDYRRSARGRACEACGRQDGTIVGAHVRSGEHAGMGQKPDDALLCWLCGECHADQEAHPGPEWWFTHVFKPMLRRRYERWLLGREAA